MTQRSHRLAAIDIGSNTLKLTIADVSEESVTPVTSRADVVLLGKGLAQTGAIELARIDHALEILASYVRLVNEHDAVHMSAIATEAVRIARNGASFISRIQTDLGVAVEIVSGEREGQLTTTGVLSQLDGRGSLLIVDIGGGSTELVRTVDGKITTLTSLPVGSGSQTDRFVRSNPPDSFALDQIENETDRIVAPFLGTVDTSSRLVIVGGVGEFLARAVSGHAPLPVTALDVARERVLMTTAEDLAPVLGTSVDRARVVPAGFAIARAVARIAKPCALETVNNGIRIGMLIELARKMDETPES